MEDHASDKDASLGEKPSPSNDSINTSTTPLIREKEEKVKTDEEMPSTSTQAESLPLSIRPASRHNDDNVTAEEVRVTGLGGSSLLLLRDDDAKKVEVPNVPIFWRVSQLVVFVTIFFTGFLSFIPSLRNNHALNGNCMLYAVVHLQGVVGNVTVESVEWGAPWNCTLSTYIFVCASIYSFILCWFFLVCSGGKAGAVGDHPSYLVIPSLIVSLILCVPLIIASSRLTQGIDALCDQTGAFTSCHELVLDVERVANEVSRSHSRRHYEVYDQLLVSEISAWIASSMWMLASAILLLRFLTVADFPKKVEVSV